MSGKTVATNKKARHDYFIDSTIEAGIVLKGPEVKSLRAGKANLKDGYAKIKNNELLLYGVHISQYSHTTHGIPDPVRVRKLLVHKREIKKLIVKTLEKGFALIPLSIYFISSGKAKLELGLGKGKKNYDKRATLKKMEGVREMDRAILDSKRG